MASQELRKLLKAKQVAEYLGIHEQTLYDLVEKKAIPHSRVGRSIRFNPSEIIDWHRQDVQPKVINYQPPIVMVGGGKITNKEESKMRKGSSKPLQGRWNTESGTIFTRVTKGGKVRYVGLYYDADKKLRENVLSHARNFDEAMVELNAIYDDVFRKKHGIAEKQKRTKLSEFVAENKVNSRIKGLLKHFGDKWLDDISELSVIAYVRKREEAGSADNSINNDLILLRSTLNLAKRGHYAVDGQIKWGKCLKKQEFRDRVLSEEEEQRLVAELPSHLKPIVACALNTGMRRGEILSLKWKNIVDQQIVLEARNTKTKKQRRIPINSKLFKFIKIVLSRNGSEFVFTYGGKKMGTIQTGFATACKKAGIDDLHFHDLRRTFATRLMRNGVGIYTISQLLGHASVEMTQRYVNWQPEDGAEAVESLVDNKALTLYDNHIGSEPRDIRGMEENEQPVLPLVTSRAS